ncbi:uridine nucleosidase [Histoplasma capsulatum var. duboisii H88]|uniref:Uridine nucleosidase n=1 Tax=Ajellomyces capsulatus (strain H88) TaxID=544711 RepID=F0U9A5_AJEC8|nr:uridine nucleosidase [Histoplasma capsulatum var. duboisii H88]QSS52515.1 uridine nucleosidase [Histoplasma capsulatum var. duboisii H88]
MLDQTPEFLSHEGQVTPLWLDCDPGHDDAFAILLAAHHPSLKLLGISTVHGNGSLQNTTVNAGSILEAIGRSDIPVYPGAAKPFCRAAVHAQDIHGVSGLDGTDLLPAPTRPPMRNRNAIVAMRDSLLEQPKNTAWLVATGTLTNVGLLFATFPEVAEHVRGLSIMGGAIGGGFSHAPICKRAGDESRVGNITPWAEFNIYCDPESAQSIFSSPALAPKTVLIPLDLTHQVLCTPKVQSLILQTERQPVMGRSNVNLTPSVLRQILHSLLLYFAGTYETVFGLDVGPPLHDPVAVAVLLSNLNSSDNGSSHARYLHFDDRDGERFLVNVVTDGQHGSDRKITGEVGRTNASPVERGKAGVTIPRGVDVDAFWNIVLECLRRADDWNALRVGNRN